MKYRVIDYVSDEQEEQTGTCELCFGTALVENGYITLEDENGATHDVYLTVWDWGDFDTIYIPNLVDFSAWLQEQDEPVFEDIESTWSWLFELVGRYEEEMEETDEN